MADSDSHAPLSKYYPLAREVGHSCRASFEINTVKTLLLRSSEKRSSDAPKTDSTMGEKVSIYLLKQGYITVLPPDTYAAMPVLIYLLLSISKKKRRRVDLLFSLLSRRIRQRRCDYWLGECGWACEEYHVLVNTDSHGLK